MCRGAKCDIPSAKSIKISHWNIHGVKSKMISDKLIDEDFLNKIRGSDIIGLTELHTNEVVSIPGYKLLKQKFREKHHKGPKISGGLAVFVKTYLQNAVIPIPNSNEDSIWIKVKQNPCNEVEDIYIGTFYISPTHKRNKHEDDLFKILHEETGRFKDKGSVFVQGDFNARIGQNEDFITQDKFDEVFGIDNNQNFPTRNSDDYTTNNRGKDLLDFCKVNDYLIVNGRKMGDMFGNFTSHQWNGSSVVDYFITQNINLDKIFSFSVGDFVPWISDHCPLHAKIILNSKNLTENNESETLYVREPRFIWDVRCKEKFNKNLASQEINDHLEAMFSQNETEPTPGKRNKRHSFSSCRYM